MNTVKDNSKQTGVALIQQKSNLLPYSPANALGFHKVVFINKDGSKEMFVCDSYQSMEGYISFYGVRMKHEIGTDVTLFKHISFWGSYHNDFRPLETSSANKAFCEKYYKVIDCKTIGKDRVYDIDSCMTYPEDPTFWYNTTVEQAQMRSNIRADVFNKDIIKSNELQLSDEKLQKGVESLMVQQDYSIYSDVYSKWDNRNKFIKLFIHKPTRDEYRGYTKELTDDSKRPIINSVENVADSMGVYGVTFDNIFKYFGYGNKTEASPDIIEADFEEVE